MRDFGNRGGNFRRGGDRGGDRGGFRRSFGPREMHKAVCSACGKECEVPFKPIEGKPVYCKECYMSKKDERFGGKPKFEPKSEKKEESAEKEEAEESSEEESFEDEEDELE